MHNALDDVSNCRKILSYLDTKGVNLRINWDKQSDTLAVSGPLAESLEIEIVQGEADDIGNALLCKEKFEGEKE